jgi:hypothetical protein
VGIYITWDAQPKCLKVTKCHPIRWGGALYTLINGVVIMFNFIPVFFFVKGICSFSSGCIELDGILVISFGVESASAGLTCQSNKSLSSKQEQHRTQSTGLIKCCCLYRRFCCSYCIHMKLGNLKIGCSIFRSITHGPFRFPSKGWSCWISTDIYRPAGWVELLPNGVNCLNPKHVGKLLTILDAAAVNLVQSVLCCLGYIRIITVRGTITRCETGLSRLPPKDSACFWLIAVTQHRR